MDPEFEQLMMAQQGRGPAMPRGDGTTPDK